jgi:hypothetical protein
MTTKPLPRPRDPISLAKLIGDIATGQVEDGRDDGKDAAAVSMGKKGGAARAKSLSAKERAEIARKAATSRWKAPSDAQ